MISISPSFFDNVLLEIFHRFFFVIPGSLLIVDLALTGSGQWSEPLGFSARRVMLLLIMSYSFVAWITPFFKLPRGGAGPLGLMVFLVIWGVMLPSLYGVPLASALNDSQLFLGLLFAPAIAQMIVRIGCWPAALRLIEYSIWFLALLHIAILLIEKLSGLDAEAFVSIMRSILEPGQTIDDPTNFLVGFISPGEFRVFWGSSIFLLLGLYLTVKRFARRRLVFNIFLFFLIFFAIQSTLTRAMILSIPLFFVLTWIFNKLLIRIRLGTALFLGVGMALLAVTLPIVLLANPNLLASIDLGREGSDYLRYDQVRALIDGIMRNPFFGNGMGSHVSLIRSQITPWMYELSILALFMKIGLLGAAWLILVLVLFGRSERIYRFGNLPLPSVIRKNLSRIAALLFCVIFCGNTNPYLFSMLGWGLLMFIYIEFSISTHQLKIERAFA